MSVEAGPEATVAMAEATVAMPMAEAMAPRQAARGSVKLILGEMEQSRNSTQYSNRTSIPRKTL
jgi:hypothetical protein